MLDEQLQLLNSRIIRYANHVETMIENSIKGLLEKDEKLLDKVINQMENFANDYEIEIDELCLNSLALFQPEAKSLRIVLMISKMNNDLERIGDLATNIAKSAKFLISKPEVKPLIDIPRMADEAIKMLRNSITAFINEDDLLAVEVLKNDDIVDNLRDQILRELITYMSEKNIINRSIHLILIARNLERAADLATNIAEDVIFIAKGRVIKHNIERD